MSVKSVHTNPESALAGQGRPTPGPYSGHTVDQPVDSGGLAAQQSSRAAAQQREFQSPSVVKCRSAERRVSAVKVSWLSRLNRSLHEYLGSVIDGVSSSSVNKVVSIRDRNSNVIEDNIDGRKGNPSVGSHVVGGHRRSGGMVSGHTNGEKGDSSMACAHAPDIAGLDPSFAENAAPLERPQNVSGSLGIDNAADHSCQMGGQGPVGC